MEYGVVVSIVNMSSIAVLASITANYRKSDLSMPDWDSIVT